MTEDSWRRLRWRNQQPALFALSRVARKNGFWLELLQELKRPWIQRLGIRTVLDVGAAEGFWSKTASIAFPKADIYAFEPNPVEHAKLLHRMRGMGSFRSFPVALGDRNGKAAFHVNEYPAASSLYRIGKLHQDHFRGTSRTRTIRVPVCKMDVQLAGIPLRKEILLNMDVQGAELAVLRGARRILAQTRLIVLEVSYRSLYRNQPLFDEVHRQIRALGFQYRGILDQIHSPLDGQPLQADCIYLR